MWYENYAFSVWNLHHSSPKAILTPGTFGIIVSKLKAFLTAKDGLFGHMWSSNCTRMRTQQAKQDHQEKVVVGHSGASLWSRSKSKQVNYRIQNKTRQSRSHRGLMWNYGWLTLTRLTCQERHTFYTISGANVTAWHWLSWWLVS